MQHASSRASALRSSPSPADDAVAAEFALTGAAVSTPSASAANDSSPRVISDEISEGDMTEDDFAEGDDPVDASSAAVAKVDAEPGDRLDAFLVSQLVFMHLGCLAVLWVGFSWTALGLAVALYLVRAFGLTGFYHRYFAHRAFKTSRWFQFFGALLGASALQNGPLWWAAHHRDHHRHSDKDADVHSPLAHGFLWSHFGWFLTRNNNQTRTRRIPDFLKFPELRWLDRSMIVVAVTYAAVLYGVGAALGQWAPGVGLTGPRTLVWGFFVSTVFLYHVTYSVNSISHLFGGRRYATSDGSRNNLLVALLALGEGWHNNHHHYPHSVRQGFAWWEIDVTYYVLYLFARLGLVWDLRPVPAKVYAGRGKRSRHERS